MREKAEDEFNLVFISEPIKSFFARKMFQRIELEKGNDELIE